MKQMQQMTKLIQQNNRKSPHTTPTNTRMHRQFDYHNIQSRAEKLYSRAQESIRNTEKTELIQDLKIIDEQITEILY